MDLQDAFLRDVAQHPADDGPRLVYADWLDEHGQPGRAEFIRTQVQLESLDRADDRRWALLVREARLRGAYGKGWAGKALRSLVRGWRFRRGFVEEVTLSADAFLRNAEELFRLAPVRRVRLVDAGGHIGDLAACPHLARLEGLDLRHTDGLDPARAAALLASPHLAGLRFLGLRGTGMCSGPGLRALAACPRLANLTALDLGDHRRDPTRGRRRAWRAGGWDGVREWRARTPASALDADAMRALTESPHLADLRCLRLAGFGGSIRAAAWRVLFDSPLLGRLTDLDLSLNYPWAAEADSEDEQAVRILRDLARSPRTAGLRALSLRRSPPFGDFPIGEGPFHLAGLASLTLEDASPAPEFVADLAGGRFSGLVELHIRGTFLRRPYRQSELVRRLAQSRGLPRLALLDLHQTQLSPGELEALAAGPLLGQLRWLSLGNRSGYGSTPVGFKGAGALAGSPHAARLVHLDLGNHDLDDPAACVLARSPHLGGLRSLNLWHNRIGPSGAADLVSLPALEWLDLRSNPLPPAARAALRRRFGPGVRYGPGRLLADDLRPPRPNS
jgi:uncharacterized protein (TIGR02996 family)